MTWTNESSVHYTAGTLDQIQSRIVRGAAAAPTDDSLSYEKLVEQSGSTNGSVGAEGQELVWLDCLHVKPLQGREGWEVQYHVCRMVVEQARQPPAAHTATLVPSSSAPEGFAVEVL